MTTNQKQKALDMHRRGLTYTEIADTLGLPKNTVKTFCWRNKRLLCDASNAAGIKENKETKNQCEHCGKPLEQRPKKKPRRFCDDACRLAWWKDNRDCINRKAVYHHTCANCGEDFDSYGNKERKYCCHNCYIAARFNNGASKAVSAV